MANIIGVYEMYVYDDGHVEMQPKIININNAINTNECSSSIRQIILVLEYVIETAKNNPRSQRIGNNVPSIRRSISIGVNNTAQQLNINPVSVHEKFTKKLDLDMAGFKDQVEKYFNQEESELEDILKGACVARTKRADAIAVGQLINKMQEAVIEYNR